MCESLPYADRGVVGLLERKVNEMINEWMCSNRECGIWYPVNESKPDQDKSQNCPECGSRPLI